MRDLAELLTALAALPALSELTNSDAFWLVAGIVLARWYNHQPPAPAPQGVGVPTPTR